MLVIFFEATFLSDTLHAHHTDGLRTDENGYTEIRLDVDTYGCRADLLAAGFHIAIDQQGLACFDDLARQPFAELNRREFFAESVRELNPMACGIQQGNIGNVGI